MCRSIKVLRRPAPVATGEEIEAASLQFVRKVSGYRKPSKSNQAAFDAAVREITESTSRLLETLPPTFVEPAKPKPRVYRPNVGARPGASPDSVDG
jgi:hypothetical protein